MSIKDRFREQSPEVYDAVDGVVTFTRGDADDLKKIAMLTARQRARLCAHGDPGAALHEMLIVHRKGAYIRPHRHIGKAESTLVLEGEVRFILFDAAGVPVRSEQLSAAGGNKPYFIRIPAETYHTLLIRSDWLTFLEVTTGPFDRVHTEFASWAPADADEPEVARYVRGLHAIEGV